MSFTEIKRREIKNYILRKIDEDDEALIAVSADAFGISATSVKRYLDAEVREGHIKPDGKRKCGYDLLFKKKTLKYPINDYTENDDGMVFTDVLPLIDPGSNGRRIWRYVLPEMFNNALEHSDGKNITVCVEAGFLYSRIILFDDGIGVFKRITESMKSYGFKNPRFEDAVTELYKGKFTSCPERHTGEGIFFSSRMLDRFAISSDGMIMRVGYAGSPSVVKSHLLAYAEKLTKKGTVVVMQLENNTRREIEKVFSEYTTVDEGFIRTRIPVPEACQDHDPVARSQARRICRRLENFQEAVLDFENADIMGQGFADELFRVFHNAHPEVVLTPVNMNSFVQKMYLYTINNKVTVPDFS